MQFVDNPNKDAHAEMKLLPEIIKSKDKDNLIITSKLCCNTCQNCLNSAQDISKQNIKSVGTHGKTYPGWTLPEGLDPKVEEGVFKRLKQDYDDLSKKDAIIKQKAKKKLDNKLKPDKQGFREVVYDKSKSKLQQQFQSQEQIIAKQQGEIVNQQPDTPQYLLKARELGDKIKKVSNKSLVSGKNSSTKAKNISFEK